MKSRSESTTPSTPIGSESLLHEPAPATRPFPLPTADAHDRSTSAEAANLARLGDYGFVYAMLAAVADTGLLAMATTLGVPLDGPFGGLAVFRLLLRLAAASAGILVLYTGACASEFAVYGWRRPSMQFFCVAVFFGLLGLDYGDLTIPILHLLGWIANHGAYV